MAYSFSCCSPSMLGLKLQNRATRVLASRRNIIMVATTANLLQGMRSSGDEIIAANSLEAKQLDEKQYASKKEFYFHVFFHEIFVGADRTSDSVIDPKANYPNFGETSIMDVPLWDSRQAEKLIARLQGVSVSSDKKQHAWYLSFNVLFETPEFKGSTLQVMGYSLQQGIPREWSIVGGTGVFTLARGIIYGRRLESGDNTLWVELKIQGDYSPVKPPSWD